MQKFNGQINGASKAKPPMVEITNATKMLNNRRCAGPTRITIASEESRLLTSPNIRRDIIGTIRSEEDAAAEREIYVAKYAMSDILETGQRLKMSYDFGCTYRKIIELLLLNKTLIFILMYTARPRGS